MSQFASSTFTGADGTELNAADANWVKAGGVSGALKIQGNAVQQTSTTSACYRHTTAPASADYSASLDVVVNDSTSLGAIGPAVRINSSVATHYFSRVSLDNNAIELYKVVSGSPSFLGSYPYTRVVGATTRLTLEVVGTSLNVYANGTLVIGPFVDTQISGAGYAGVRSYSPSVQPSTGLVGDNFSADQASSGVTSVSSDFGGNYQIRSVSASDLGPAFQIRASISADNSVVYNIQAHLSADIAVSYNVRNSMQIDLSPAYNLRNAIAVDGLASYNLRGSVSADLVPGYGIQNAGTVTSDLVLAYRLRAMAQSDASISYELRGVVQASLAENFALRTASASDLSTSYAVAGAVSAVSSDLACSYSVFGMAVSGPSAAEIAAAVIAAAQASPIWADVRDIRGHALTGSGQVGDEFGV